MTVFPAFSRASRAQLCSDRQGNSEQIVRGQLPVESELSKKSVTEICEYINNISGYSGVGGKNFYEDIFSATLRRSMGQTARNTAARFRPYDISGFPWEILAF